jgi:1-acyl-sn-glycerol-3-phosphate acyltransferase
MFWIRVGAIVFYRINVSGRNRIPQNETFLFAGNHLSNLDPPIFGAFSKREIHFFAKEELFSKPILSWLLPALFAFPVDREGNVRRTLKQSVTLLREGKCVGIFPEGRRSTEGDRDVRLGMAWLAYQAGVPVLPAAIAGSKGAKLFRAEIKVAYGDLVWPPPGKATKDDLAKFTESIMAAIDALYEGIGGNS